VFGEFMPFKSKEELAGQTDPNINTKGQFKSPNRPTKRKIKEKEMLSLLRKLKPHVAEAVRKAAEIMGTPDASHQNQLKAAVILLDNYKQMVNEVYDKEDDDGEVAQPVQQENVPLFSLKVVNGDSE
jgi:hypothetical protein